MSIYTTNLEIYMKSITILLAALLMSVSSFANHNDAHHEEILIAAQPTAEPILLSATEIEAKWSKGNMTKGGMSQAVLVGDPTKAGLYVIRLKFTDGFCLAAHSHPDSREITVMQGEWLSGYGDRFEASKLKSLPAGSFYTEPAGVPHFTRTKGETILQVSGIGPSGRHFTHESECK